MAHRHNKEYTFVTSTPIIPIILLLAVNKRPRKVIVDSWQPFRDVLWLGTADNRGPTL